MVAMHDMAKKGESKMCHRDTAYLIQCHSVIQLRGGLMACMAPQRQPPSGDGAAPSPSTCRAAAVLRPHGKVVA